MRRTRIDVLCDRCHDRITEVEELADLVGRAVRVQIDAEKLGLGTIVFDDLCAPCKKTVTALLAQLVTNGDGPDGPEPAGARPPTAHLEDTDGPQALPDT